MPGILYQLGGAIDVHHHHHLDGLGIAAAVLSLSSRGSSDQHGDAVMVDEGQCLPAAEAFAELMTTEAAADYVRRSVSHHVHPVGTAHIGRCRCRGGPVWPRACSRSAVG